MREGGSEQEREGVREGVREGKGGGRGRKCGGLFTPIKEEETLTFERSAAGSLQTHPGSACHKHQEGGHPTPPPPPPPPPPTTTTTE